MSDALQTHETSSWSAGILCPGQGGGRNSDIKMLDDQSEADRRPRRVIIVEDEIFVALHLETILQDLGFEVCEIIATGREALDFALRIQPDIIFMDINLRGDIDGIEAARLIREQTGIPVVFVTAYGDEATLKRVEAVAPDAPVLQKPAMTQALVAAISKVMGS
jgi:CheY-like chemotaxis protein